MQFLYPAFLWALLALAIPVIIHLFNFRRYKTIYFTRLKFLQKATEETKKGNVIKKRLILASRLLAFTFLVFAFAQPVLVSKNKKPNIQSKSVSIYLDNSLSMLSEGEEGQLFESAKSRTRDIIKSLSPTDKVQIITNDLDGVLMQFVNRDAALDEVDKIRSTPSFITLDEVVKTIDKVGTDNKQKHVYLISDFQKNICQPVPVIADSNIFFNLVQLPLNPPSNISIDSCWFASPVLQPNQPLSLILRVRNFSPENIKDLPIVLNINGNQKGLTSISLSPYESAETSIQFTMEQAGFVEANLSLPGDKIAYDDKLFFSFWLKPSQKIVSISQQTPDKYINSLFAGKSDFELENFNQNNIQYNAFANAGLIVLQGPSSYSSGLILELRNYLMAGGNVLIFPPADEKLDELNKCMAFLGGPTLGNSVSNALNVSFIDREHPLFGNVFQKFPQNPDLPSVTRYMPLSSVGSAIMKLQNGDVFLSNVPVGKGQLLVCSTPLDDNFGNFHKHSIFVLIAIRASMLKPNDRALYHYAGQRSFIPLENSLANNQNYYLNNGTYELAPEIISRNNQSEMNTNGEIRVPGHYHLRSKDNRQILETLAFNIQRKESDTRPADEELFEKMAENLKSRIYNQSSAAFSSALKGMQHGTPFWKWCILLVLFFLLIEILLIRFLKN